MVLPLLFSVVATLVVVVPLALAGVALGREAASTVRWLTEVRGSGLQPPALLDRLPWLHDQVHAWWMNNLADPAGARALLERTEQLDPMRVGRLAGVALLRGAVEFAFTVVALFFLFREGDNLGAKALGLRLSTPPEFWFSRTFRAACFSFRAQNPCT